MHTFRINSRGVITLSEGSVFLNARPGMVLDETAPEFAQIILHARNTSEYSTSVKLKAVEIELFQQQGIFDFHLSFPARGEILCEVFNYTEQYEYSRSIQQQKHILQLREEDYLKDQSKFVQEINKLAFANKELKQLDKFRSEFIAKVSHDFRAPIHGIVGLTSLLRNESLSEDGLSYLDALGAAAQYLEAQVNDLSDFEKIEAGSLSFEHNHFNISKMIRGLMDCFEYKVREKGIKLTCITEPGVPENVTGDEHRLSQILFNLIGNAVKFTGKGSVELTISAIDIQSTRSLIKFKIKDSGIGIRADDLEKIFQPYFQGNANDREQYGGSGLGLTIVKQLVDLQGGNIFVESSPTSGTTFEFFLEFGNCSVADAPDWAGMEKVNFKGLKFLLVEDQKLNQMVISGILSETGAQIDIAATTEEAIRLLRDTSYNVIMTDLNLGEATGLDLLAGLRGDVSCLNHAARMVTISGSEVGRDFLQTTFMMGLAGHLKKPATPVKLVEKLRNVLNSDHGQLHLHNLDISYLIEVSGGNPSKLKELLRIFSTEVRMSFHRIGESLRQGEFKQVASDMHKLKTNFTYIQAKELMEMTAMYETETGIRNDSIGISGKMEEMGRRIEVLTGKIDNYVKNILDEIL